MHEDLARRGKCEVAATLLARKDTGRLEGTIITGSCHKQLLGREHVERGNCGRPGKEVRSQGVKSFRGDKVCRVRGKVLEGGSHYQQSGIARDGHPE